MTPRRIVLVVLIFWLIFLSFSMVSMWSSTASLPDRIAGTGAMLLFASLGCLLAHFVRKDFDL